jgi:N-acetylglucosamine-6-sulfatase
MRLILSVSLAATLAVGAIPPDARAATTQPNVVLIVTDDQRWDTLWSMPNLQRELVADGMDFTHYHVVTPLCCPARAQILTGQYAHTNGVYGNKNDERRGGFNAFDDSASLATMLHEAGYRTALIGKYLNGYGAADANEPASYVPPGWDDWEAILNQGGGKYDHFVLNENGASVEYSDYITNVLGQKVVNFIDGTDPRQPFFVEWAPTAPHAAAVPEAKYRSAFSGLRRWRPPSYNERNISDKPKWFQSFPRIARHRRRSIDAFRRNQYRTLLTVDDWVGSIVDALRANGALDNTIIAFTSDNGFFWGEHRLHAKDLPYEEATRVPLVLRYDGIGAVGKTGTLAADIDLAPTFADLAGTVMPNADGISLAPFLRGTVRVVRREHLIEQESMTNGVATGVPAWCMLQTRRFTFTHYATGEEELYNLKKDPYQLRNTIDGRATRSRVRSMRAEDRALCRPLPPGMKPW